MRVTKFAFSRPLPVVSLTFKADTDRAMCDITVEQLVSDLHHLIRMSIAEAIVCLPCRYSSNHPHVFL